MKSLFSYAMAEKVKITLRLEYNGVSDELAVELAPDTLSLVKEREFFISHELGKATSKLVPSFLKKVDEERSNS